VGHFALIVSAIAKQIAFGIQELQSLSNKFGGHKASTAVSELSLAVYAGRRAECSLDLGQQQI
jgi:hypothetical protein